MHFNSVLGVLFSVIVISSCVNSDSNEIAELKHEISTLQTRVDSLEAKYAVLTEIKLIPEKVNIKKTNKRHIKPVTVPVSSQRSSNESSTNGLYKASSSSKSGDWGRCQATTKKGTQCKRTSRSGGYCWQHGG